MSQAVESTVAWFSMMEKLNVEIQIKRFREATPTEIIETYRLDVFSNGTVTCHTRDTQLQIWELFQVIVKELVDKAAA